MKQTTAIYTLTSELHDEKAVSAVTQAFLTSLGIARSSSSNCWISPLLPSASANHLHRFANQVPVPMIRRKVTVPTSRHKGTVTRGLSQGDCHKWTVPMCYYRLFLVIGTK